MQAAGTMTTIADSVVAEMDQEAVATRNLFKVIPQDKLDWRPHPKARTLGQLALHIAEVPEMVAGIADLDEWPGADFPPEPQPATVDEILARFEESLEKGKSIVASTGDERAAATWRLVRDGNEVLSMPRKAFWRTVLLNHYYHHRGQLSAYLRELDVKLPSIYGPSADTNPFAS